MSDTQDHSFVLMGLKHCGKSTQGRLLAKELEVDFFDTDEVIEEAVGQSVRSFYKKKGVSAFMLEEEKACDKLVSENQGKQIVVATGGGICDNPPAITKLRVFQKFVFLRLDIEYSVARVCSKIEMINPGQFINAPAYILAEKPKSMREVNEILTNKYTQRYAQYEALADIIVDIKNASIEENFNLIKAALL